MQIVKYINVDTITRLQPMSPRRLKPGADPANGESVPLGAAEAETLRNEWSAAMRDAIIRNSGSWTNSDSDESRGLGLSIKVSDDGVNYPDIRVTFRVKEGVKTPQFKKLVAEGRIIVSGYRVAYITGVSRPGYKDTNLSHGGVGYCYMEKLINVPGFKGTRFFITEEIFISPQARWVTVNYLKANRNWLPALPLSEDDLLGVAFPGTIDCPMVAGTLSNINTATLDALTALAEAPETIRWVLSLIGDVGKAFRATKNRELTLTAAFDKRRSYLNEKLQEDIANLAKTTKSWKVHQRKLRRLEKTYRRAVKESADELASAIASVWLQYRYAIMPNVYLIEDVLKGLDQGKYITKRGWNHTSESLSLAGETFSVEVEHKVMIKREVNSVTPIGVLSANLLVTAWEMVPLSFVVDWFISVGDFLSGLAVSYGVAQEGSTYSKQARFESRIKNDSNQVIELHGQTYIRSVIKPESFTGIYFDPFLNRERYLDSVALWQSFRKRFRK